jgi:hypothetical protein
MSADGAHPDVSPGKQPRIDFRLALAIFREEPGGRIEHTVSERAKRGNARVMLSDNSRGFVPFALILAEGYSHPANH